MHWAIPVDVVIPVPSNAWSNRVHLQTLAPYTHAESRAFHIRGRLRSPNASFVSLRRLKRVTAALTRQQDCLLLASRVEATLCWLNGEQGWALCSGSAVPVPLMFAWRQWPESGPVSGPVCEGGGSVKIKEDSWPNRQEIKVSRCVP